MKRCRHDGIRQENRSGPPAAPQHHALFLDVDGTLLTIAAQPDGVRVTDRLRALLRRLQERLDGAVALISGRSIEDLDRLFAPLVLPAAGVHGLERRGRDGRRHHAATATDLESLRRPLGDYAARHDGLLVEDKGRALALHYRAAPRLREEVESFLRRLLADTPAALHLTRGKMVFELRAGTADKGTAITDFMAEPPFAGRVPVFIGDDVTDEDGFRSVNSLGGLSIRVGPPTETAAAYSLPDEEAVEAWLSGWLAATEKDDST